MGRYEEEDEALLMQADADVLQERQAMTDAWNAWLDRSLAYAEQVAEFRRERLGARASEAEFTMESMSVEQVLETREELYNTSA